MTTLDDKPTLWFVILLRDLFSDTNKGKIHNAVDLKSFLKESIENHYAIRTSLGINSRGKYLDIIVNNINNHKIDQYLDSNINKHLGIEYDKYLSMSAYTTQLLIQKALQKNIDDMKDNKNTIDILMESLSVGNLIRKEEI